MRTVLRVFGECSVTAGAVVLLFLTYLLWGTALATSAHQHAFATQLQRQWRTHRDAKPVTTRLHLVTGQPFAFIRIPRFGRAWRFAIVEGTGLPVPPEYSIWGLTCHCCQQAWRGDGWLAGCCSRSSTC
jgi:sortase A